MEILLTLIYSVFFLFVIHKMKFFFIEGVSKKTISGIFILKILFGLMLWAIYTFYYTDRATADIYKYFDDSKVIFDALKSNPLDYFKMLFGIGNNAPEFQHYYSEMNFWKKAVDSNVLNDSHTIIRFNAFVRLFSFGYYNVHTIFICFLSLIGLTAIYKTFIPYLPEKKNELLAVVFLLPSVLFWGSGVLKEGLIFFALGLLVYYFNRLLRIKAIFICIGVTLLLMLSKFYVWLSIIPGLLFIFWIKKGSTSKLFLKFIIVMLVVSAVGLNIDKFTSFQNPLVTLAQKQIEFNKLASGTMTNANHKPIPVATSAIKIRTLEPTFYSFLRNAPEALINTLFRPYIWECRSPMMLMAGFENILMIVVILLCIIFIKPLSTIRWEYVLFCFSFVILQFLIIGETTPIIGAIARYKVSSLPFLFIAFLFLLDKEKIRQKLSFYSKIFS